MAYDPENGDELWRVLHPGGFNVAARPLFAHDMIYVFTSGLTGHMLAVKVDGHDDVTESHIAWTTTKSTPHIPSPVIVDKLLFMVTDKGGIVRCLDAFTGQEIWKKRLGGDHWASPICADGKLYFLSKQGDVTVLPVSREEPEILAKNSLNASFIASPAVAGSALILRSTTHLYCLANGFERSAEQVVADEEVEGSKLENSAISIAKNADTDWEKAYAQLIAENAGVREKIESGGVKKEQIVGKQVKLVGVAGQFLDNLLQIKRGETFKVRTGDFNPETNELGFGFKFQVLERTSPFKPEDFGVLPDAFRGFQGELVGKVIEATGYEVLLEVAEAKAADGSQATDASSIQGRRIRIAGFYNDHRDLFTDLHEGDSIRVSVMHRSPAQDALDVTKTLKKISLAGTTNGLD